MLDKLLGYMHSLDEISNEAEEESKSVAERLQALISGAIVNHQQNAGIDNWPVPYGDDNGENGQNAGNHDGNEGNHNWPPTFLVVVGDDDWHGPNAGVGDDWHGPPNVGNGGDWHGPNVADGDDWHGPPNAGDNGEWQGPNAGDNEDFVDGDWHGDADDDWENDYSDEDFEEWQSAGPINIAEICTQINADMARKKDADSHNRNWRTSKKSKRLFEFCEALERDQCKAILESHGISFETSDVPRSRKLNLLVSLLVNGTVEFLDMIGLQLLALSDNHVADAINETKEQDLEIFEWGLVEYKIEVANEAVVNHINYRCFYPSPHGCTDASTAEYHQRRGYETKTLKIWLDIGFGPIAGEGECINSYLRWLDFEMREDDELHVSTVRILGARRVLEALLYANPDVMLNKDSLVLGLKVNERFHSGAPQMHWFTPARFLLDGKQHGICGHDVLALNMVTPYLLECGFIAPENFIAMCHKNSLHPAVYSYVQHALTTPKSLKVSCRNAIRRHFVGPRIHKYMAAYGKELPSFIKDFVLLKPLLRCIPKQLLDKLSEKFLE